MTRDRDVAAFDRRATGYEQGWRGDLHRRIADRSGDIALSHVPTPNRILDVGCGTGYLLRQLAARCPATAELDGIDPAPAMIETASTDPNDPRLHFSEGVAEHLSFPDAHFDLVVTTTSFDHWVDQKRGLEECARVMTPGGHLVLTDLFSVLLLPTLMTSHRGRVRTIRQATTWLESVGFKSIEWANLRGITSLAGMLIRTVTATKE